MSIIDFFFVAYAFQKKEHKKGEKKHNGPKPRSVEGRRGFDNFSWRVGPGDMVST